MPITFRFPMRSERSLLRLCVRAVFSALLYGIILLWTTPSVAQSDRITPETVVAQGYVVLMRHALAPGTGDPAQFEVDDCSTQRILNDVGRDQARAIGARLKQAGMETARVWSSQWCRCLETAELLDLGPVMEETGLNSFFRNRAEEPAVMGRLAAALSAAPVEGAPLILVTHMVNQASIAGDWTPSGGALAMTRDPDAPGRLRLVGEIDWGL